jgi:hypothetical protein
MSRFVRSWAAVLVIAAVLVSWVGLPFLARATPPKPGGATAGVDGPPEPLEPLVPLVPLPEPLAPLAPLVPLPPPKIPLFFRVTPEAPRPCPGDQVAFTIWVGQAPPGMTMQQASDQNLLRGVANAKVTVTDNGKPAASLRTNALGLVQPEWKWTAKSGRHTLVFKVTPPSGQYQAAAPITRTIKVETCKAELSLNYKESVIVPNNAIGNELTIKLLGTVEADADGRIAATDMTASFDTFTEGHVPECVYSFSGVSGSFNVSVSGQASEDTFDLDVTGGPLNYGPVTGTGTCQGRSKSFTFPVKSVDAIKLMALASLSFHRDGGSQSYSLPKAMLLVGTGTQYADVTVSLEPIDAEKGGAGS